MSRAGAVGPSFEEGAQSFPQGRDPRNPLILSPSKHQVRGCLASKTNKAVHISSIFLEERHHGRSGGVLDRHAGGRLRGRLRGDLRAPRLRGPHQAGNGVQGLRQDHRRTGHDAAAGLPQGGDEGG